jgi:hypothetical protein
MRFQGMAESIGPMLVRTKTKSWGGTDRLPMVGPVAQAKERVGRTTPFSSSAMSSAPGYSLIGLLASRARLRFTGTARIKLWTAQRKRIIIER